MMIYREVLRENCKIIEEIFLIFFFLVKRILICVIIFISILIEKYFLIISYKCLKCFVNESKILEFWILFF